MKKIISFLLICAMITGCSTNETVSNNSVVQESTVSGVESSVNSEEGSSADETNSDVSSGSAEASKTEGTSGDIETASGEGNSEDKETSSTDNTDKEKEPSASSASDETSKPEETSSADEATSSTVTSSKTEETSTVTPPVAEEPSWTETETNCTMYINTNGVYSRKNAIVGSTAVKKYNLNDKVSVVAVTNTNYYKLDDGSFIHKDYLSNKETVITSTTTTVTTPTVPTTSDAEKLLNGAKLNPMKTNDEDVDSLVSEALSQITNDGMSTYQKVVAIYDYIIRTFTYGKFRGVYWSDPNYHMAYDSVIAASAYGMFKEKRGVCDDYASLFVVMTRAIGLESYIVSGQIKSGGSSSGHTWVLMKLNGEYYVFDAQVDQVNSTGGQISHKYFCRSESSVANIYTYGYNYTMKVCLRYSVEDVSYIDNPRDFSIALFGNFVVDEGEKTYVIEVGY